MALDLVYRSYCLYPGGGKRGGYGRWKRDGLGGGKVVMVTWRGLPKASMRGNRVGFDVGA